MTHPPRQVYLVSHTHWDREWYRTFHDFRVDLAHTVRQVLTALENDTAFEHFVLDGQTILLEDHLALHPEDSERIQRLVSQGKLAVGPWYILPDEFLVSAEATVRNLLIGHEVAARFGPVQKVGYLPDSFGHVAQLPQILKLAGIDSFIYTRGNGEEISELGWEYRWQAPDGSEVLAVNQCGGYCNAAALGLEELWHAHTSRLISTERAVVQIEEIFGRMAAGTPGDIYLLNNGCDHHPPQPELELILTALREAFPTTEFLHSSFPAYLAAVREADLARKIHRGELLGGKLHHILSGVWSSRLPLKQQNDVCQTLLADYLEPVAAYCHFHQGQEYPAGAIQDVWKLLLQNHPHDSICGCSIDAVHREMDTRFAGVAEAVDRLLRNHLTGLCPTFARQPTGDRDTVICVVNPLPVQRSEVITRLVVLQPLDYDLENLRLVDVQGRTVPFSVQAVQYVERFWGVDYRTVLSNRQQQEVYSTYRQAFSERYQLPAENRREADCYLTLQFLAEDLPSLGHVSYRLTDSGTEIPDLPAATKDSWTPVRVGGGSLENEFYRVRLHPDGTCEVHVKSTSTTYQGLNQLEDLADRGDEYDFCPCEGDAALSSAGVSGRVRVLTDSGMVAELEAEFTLSLPVALTADRHRRSQRTVTCQVITKVGLTAGCPIIRFETKFDNLALDHRLRVVFPTGLKTSVLVSDGHFYLNRRDFVTQGGQDWVQPPAQTRPQQDLSYVQDAQEGLALLNRGLPEIQASTDDTGAARLSLTLLRSVGWLSRDDLASRNLANAGPTLPTPDAQCPGMHTFHYALVPFSGDALTAGIKEISQRYRVPPLVIQGVEDGHMPGGESLVRTGSSLTCISAVKRHQQRDSLVVRLYNLTADPVVETLTFGPELTGSWQVDLLEDRNGEIARIGPHSLSLDLRPHEIVTLELEFA